MIQILELFGGIGAPRKALKRKEIPHKLIDYVEWKENRVRAYNAMNPFKHNQQDIRGWNLRPDILVHGSPCQDNSSANQNNDQGRSELMLETIRIVKEMGEWRPKFIIWENVRGALFKSKRPIFEEYLREMEDLGYTNSYQILNAMDFGIPQTRERIFCISILGHEEFDFNKLMHRPLRPMSEFRQKENEINDIEKYVVKIPSMLNRLKDLASVEEIESNKNKFRYIETIVNVCNTITERPDRCPSAGVFKMEDGRYRYPTEREWWRLMDFDDEDFDLMLQEFPTKEGKRNATLYALAGNSIVVSVLEAIFDAILSGNYAKEDRESQQLKLIC
ncbi:DNA cytosine methyltransferase [Planomicrobium sp. CPCC 101079]|uniref:DNA cytosine methyltransferase n=1 Tax=Planomicrobium sp. CPCC 101079 TaxID=2599618 RepID=UPI0011B3EB36|nr:DNA (cytosine-5-)-methyltransferase [Planomicrobium sp. CPCC 101079]TWT04623.1 DNA (cytosine-5-)-methyltransferase [Planomicrobium sp. CPCC 101079]